MIALLVIKFALIFYWMPVVNFRLIGSRSLASLLVLHVPVNYFVVA